MFLEIHTDRRPKTPYHYGLFREKGYQLDSTCLKL